MGRYGEIVRVINRMRTPRDFIELHRTIYFPLRRECRMFSAALYARVRFYSYNLHTRPRVQRASGIPCSLPWRDNDIQTSGRSCRWRPRSWLQAPSISVLGPVADNGLAGLRLAML